MFVTLLGIEILVKLKHSMNDPSPMLVTLIGIVMDESSPQNVNAYAPILVTPLSIVTFLTLSRGHGPY